MANETRTTSSNAHMSRWSARLRRWGRRMLGGLAVVLVVVVAAFLVVVHNLDRPAIKSRLVGLVHDTAGVDIDYRTASVALLHGIVIDDLVVRTPEPMRAVEPELVHVKKLEAAWTTGLYTGATKRIDKVTLSGVSVAVVIDETGKTSFDGLGPPPAPTAAPKIPRSKKLHDTLADTAPALPGINIDDTTLVTLTRTEKGVVKERSSLSGIALNVAEAAGHVRASAGAEETPLTLEIARSTSKQAPLRSETPAPSDATAAAKLWLTVDATPTDITFALDIALTQQSFVPHLPPSPLVHARANVHIDPAHSTLGITINDTRIDAAPTPSPAIAPRSTDPPRTPPQPVAASADPAAAWVRGAVATVGARADLSDEGALVVRQAEGEVDVARALGSLPREVVPWGARLAKGRVRYKVESLAVDELPHLNADARVDVEGEFEAVDVEDIAAVDAATVSARVVPAGDGLAATAAVTVRGASAKASRVSAEDVTLDLDATQSKDGALTGQVRLGFASLDVPGMKAKSGRVTVKVADLVVDRKAPLASTGEVDLATTVAALTARPAALDRVAVRAHTKLTGKAPFAADADVTAERLRVSGGSGLIVDRPLHVNAKLADASPNRTGKVSATVESGDIQLRVDATKGADAIDYDLAADARTLSAARPFVPPAVAVEKMAASLASRGRITQLASAAPSIRHHTEVTVERPAAVPVEATSLRVVLDSSGNAQTHELAARITAKDLTVPGLPTTDARIAISAAFDRPGGWAKAKVDSSGLADASVATHVTFDAAGDNLGYDVDASLAKLAPFARFVPGLDLSALALDLHSRGTVTGRSALDGTVQLEAEHVGWASGDAAFTSGAVAVDGKVHLDAEQRTFDGKVASDEFRFASGPHAFDVAGFTDQIRLNVTGPLDRPDVESAQKIALRVLKQDVAPMYSVGDATIALAAKRTHDGVVHISTLDVTNGSGGTSLSLKGAVDTSEFARRLSLRGELTQDLARLSNAPQKLAAKGEANVTLRVESPDLAIFRTTAAVKFQDAAVQLPAAGVKVEGADGEVPILFSVRVTPKGVRMVREEEDNPYSSLRFADQHPLLSRTSFIAIKKLDLPQVSISSLVGNLQIAQNIFSLRQFEMGIRGGRITGQCALDWNGPNTTLDMHVRADGVQSSHGEPFTGSAALVVSAGEHSVEGRADILQIGKRHLLDLLDVQDPFRVDPGLNRIRTALTFGYPDKLRLMFDHGFASVHVGLGGLARIITIDDLKGVPIGPLIDQLIPPFLPSKDD